MSTELPDTPGGRALRVLVDVLNGGSVDGLVPLLDQWLRAMAEDGTIEKLGTTLRPVSVERLGNRFEHRLDALLRTSDGLRLCMIGTNSDPPHAVAFLQIRPIGGEPWKPSEGDRFVDRTRNELELVGLATAVVDGAATSFECVGDVDERSVFRIGSVSKPITATGVQLCVDDGLFSLDDPIGSLLPDVEVPAAVRVRHVVAHASGLASDAPMDVDQGERVPSVPELVAASPLRLDFEPGSNHAYSNVGYAMLGHLVATARGKPFEDVMRERLFAPLGMTDTGYVLAHTDADRLATGSQSILGFVSEVEWTDVTMLGAGSVFSTAGDLARLAHAVLDGEVPLAGWIEQGDRRWHGGAWHGFTASVLLDPAARRAALLLTNTDNVSITTLFDPYAAKLLDEACRVD